MSDQDQEFQQRWGFRRNESDLDSSSEDHSRPSSSSEPKLKKHKLIFSEENNQETINIESDPEAEVHVSSEEPNKEPSQSCKEPKPITKGRQRKVRSRKPRKKASDCKPSDTPSTDLSGYSESLIEGIRVAREDLLKWMSKEMGKPIQDDVISLKPDVKRRCQKQNARRSKAAKSNPNKGRRKSGATNQKQDEGSSQKSVKGKAVSRPINADIAETPKEPENVPTSTATVATPEKRNRKRSKPSVNKQKIAAVPPDNQPTSKTAVVALPAPAPAPASTPIPTPAPTPNYLTLPTLLPRTQPETERNPLGDGNERDFGNRNALSAGINLSSQLSCFPRAHQKDGVFAQNGPRNVNDYEQNTGLTIGNVRPNGNGNASANGFPFSLQNGNGSAGAGASGFPFSLYPHPQGLNGGIGIQNPTQFGMQFLSQDNRMPGQNRMNGGFTRVPNGNHGFMESYGALNQHLRFKTQGGSLGLQCPDIRGTNLQRRQ